MPKIKFTQAYQVRGTTPEDSPAYGVDEVVEVSDASAQHFVSRGVAELADKKPVKLAAPSAAKPESAVQDYEAMSNDELHKLATEREIEGRGSLTSKADLVKALEKDDKSATKATPPKK